MNLEALRTELAKPEYEGLSDQAAADAINAKTVTVRELVPTWKIKQYAMEQGIWGTLRIASKDAEQLPVRGLAITVLDWIDDVSGKIQSVDLDLASTQTMLGGLVQCQLATQQQAEAISALATVVKKWTDHNGIGEVGIGFIRAARS